VPPSSLETAPDKSSVISITRKNRAADRPPSCSAKPADFDMAKSKGLGMQVVTALTKQLGGTITPHSGADGTEFILSVPTSITNQE